MPSSPNIARVKGRRALLEPAALRGDSPCSGRAPWPPGCAGGGRDSKLTVLLKI